MDTQYYQGDVLFIRLNDSRAGQVRKHFRQNGVPSIVSDGRYVIARGEKTGHAHTVNVEDATLYEALFNGVATRVVVVDNPTPVEHNEHEAVWLEPGVYEVRQQRVYQRPRPDEPNIVHWAAAFD